MIHLHKKQKSRTQSNFLLVYALLSVIAAVTVLVNSTLYKQPRSQRWFGKLQIPNLAQTELPFPLILHEGSLNILGAGTFDAVDIVTNVNSERAKRNAKTLRINNRLMEAAKLRARTIIKYQNFSHQDPYDHIELGSVLPQVGYHFSYASENIGMGGNSGSDFVYGFMHSTAHRDNLLNPDLVDTGAAVESGPYKQWYVTVAVQIFAIPGGKAESLGYSDADKVSYEIRLRNINDELNPLVWTVQKLLKNSQYSDERYASLLKQRQILGQIYVRMQNDIPLTEKDVALIREFNLML